MKTLLALFIYLLISNFLISQERMEITEVILDSNTIIINIINKEDKPQIIDISKWMMEKYEVAINQMKLLLSNNDLLS